METQAEREMRNIIAAYDGRLGSPAVTIERLQLWADELGQLREKFREWDEFFRGAANAGAGI